MPVKTPTTRRFLSADGLLRILKCAFERIDDPRPKPNVLLPDALLSALAMFSLKEPSLLAFQERIKDENLKQLFGIGRVPCDTSMREILDPVEPEQLRPAFNDIFRSVQRGKALEQFVFHEGCYLLSLDGTGYFSSNKIHCDSCMQKTNSRTGEVTYYHQMLAAVLVHPDLKEVIPLAPEPIIKQDGSTKNDCERNAAKRLLRKIRKEHPHLGLIVLEDGLASNAPHIRELKNQGMHFILGAKPGDHNFLFQNLIEAYDEDRVTACVTEHKGGRRTEVSFTPDLPLNESNPDLLVNFLQCIEYDADGNPESTFSWVTDLTITGDNAQKLSTGGRARWKIENETLNTAKNQGYHLEHNFGHGTINLSVVFAMLMMLAFLVDQVQQLCCPLFQATWKKFGSKRSLWDHKRSHFRHFLFTSMKHLYEVMLHDLAEKVPAPQLDTS